MTLADYLSSHNVRQNAFADRLGISGATVSRLIKGDFPSLKLAHKIQTETDGKVSMDVWVKAA